MDKIIEKLTKKVYLIIDRYYSTSMLLNDYTKQTDEIRVFIENFNKYGIIDYATAKQIEKTVFDNAYKMYSDEVKKRKEEADMRAREIEFDNGIEIDIWNDGWQKFIFIPYKEHWAVKYNRAIAKLVNSGYEIEN